MKKQFLPTKLLSTTLSCLMLFSASNSLFAADTPVNSVEEIVAVVSPMQAGRDAVKSKNWSKAIVQFKLATAQEPKNADAYNMLAYSYRKQAKPDLSKAFENYNLALKLDPKHKGAHEYIGEAYLMDKKLAEAEKHLAILESLCGNKTCEEYQDLAKAIVSYSKK
jgi:Flp pilus assembly protein TadD